MMFSKNNKNGLTASMMDEIFGIEEVEKILEPNSEKSRFIEKVGLTLSYSKDDVLAILDGLQIPHKDKTIEEILNFIFDRLLFEYMEDQSYYKEDSYLKFKNTLIYGRLQMLICHFKNILLIMANNDYNQIPKNCKMFYRKQDLNPVSETNYLKLYERYKTYMGIVTPERLLKYYNNLVGLKHFSVKTKAIYHAFVEELELRDIDYDIMLYGKERILSYHINIITKNNKLIVVRK